MGKFVRFTGRDGQFYFRIVASNGRTIAASEGYKTKVGRDNGIQSVIDNVNRYTHIVDE